MREIMGNPDAPVVVCRGNHDFTDLTPLFGGHVMEVGSEPTSFAVLGLRIIGVRGVRAMIGEWADELDDPTFDDRCRRLEPEAQVLVSHCPPAGVLDKCRDHSEGGAPGLAAYVQRTPSLKLHCFGHIHEQRGKRMIGDILFSNAATGHNLIEI